MKLFFSYLLGAKIKKKKKKLLRKMANEKLKNHIFFIKVYHLKH